MAALPIAATELAGPIEFTAADLAFLLAIILGVIIAVLVFGTMPWIVWRDRLGWGRGRAAAVGAAVTIVAAVVTLPAAILPAPAVSWGVLWLVVWRRRNRLAPPPTPREDGEWPASSSPSQSPTPD